MSVINKKMQIQKSKYPSVIQVDMCPGEAQSSDRGILISLIWYSPWFIPEIQPSAAADVDNGDSTLKLYRMEQK